jgi:hypothetical protein
MRLGGRGRHALNVEKRGGPGQRRGDDRFPEQALGEGVEGGRQIVNAGEQALVGQAGQPLADGQRPPRPPDRPPVRRRAAQGLGEANGGAKGQAVGPSRSGQWAAGFAGCGRLRRFGLPGWRCRRRWLGCGRYCRRLGRGGL